MTSNQHEARESRDHQALCPACRRACNTTRVSEHQRHRPYPVRRGRDRVRFHGNKTSKSNRPRCRNNSRDRRGRYKKKTCDACDIQKQDGKDNGVSEWERLAETLGKKQASCSVLDPYRNNLNSEVHQPIPHTSKVSTVGTPCFSALNNKDQRDPDTCPCSDEHEKTLQDCHYALTENPSSQEAAPTDNLENPSQIPEVIMISQKEQEKSQTGLFDETGVTKNTEMCDPSPLDMFRTNLVQEQDQTNISFEKTDHPQDRLLFSIEPLTGGDRRPEQNFECEERNDAYNHEKIRINSRNKDPKSHPVQQWPILQQSLIHEPASQIKRCERVLEMPQGGRRCCCHCFCYHVPPALKQVTGNSSITPTDSEDDSEVLPFDGNLEPYSSCCQHPCQERRSNHQVFSCHHCSKLQRKELKNIFRCLRQQSQKLQKLASSLIKVDCSLSVLLRRENKRQDDKCVCSHKGGGGKHWSKETLRYRSRSPPRDSQDVHQQMESDSHQIKDQQKEERGEQQEQGPMDWPHIHQDITSNPGDERCLQCGLFAQQETPTDNCSSQYPVCQKKDQNPKPRFLLKSVKGKAALHQAYAKVAPLSLNKRMKEIGQRWKEPGPRHSSLHESLEVRWDILQQDVEEEEMEEMDAPLFQEIRERPTPSSEIKPTWASEADLCHVKIECISNNNCPNWDAGAHWQSHATQEQAQNDKSMSPAIDYIDEEIEEDTDDPSSD